MFSTTKETNNLQLTLAFFDLGISQPAMFVVATGSSQITGGIVVRHLLVTNSKSTINL